MVNTFCWNYAPKFHINIFAFALKFYLVSNLDEISNASPLHTFQNEIIAKTGPNRLQSWLGEGRSRRAEQRYKGHFFNISTLDWDIHSRKFGKIRLIANSTDRKIRLQNSTDRPITFEPLDRSCPKSIPR